MVEVIMPKMGDAMEEGTLVEWVKSDGDEVKSGDIIGNIQTDKATVELMAPSSGKLAGLLVEPGDTVPVGKPIAAVLKGGEELPEDWGSNGSAKAEKKPAGAQEAEAEGKEEKPKKAGKPEKREVEVETEEEPEEEPEEEEKKEEEKPGKEKRERVFASPLARRLAEEEGIDLAEIEGSGPKGRVTEKDVRAAGKEPKKAAVPAAAPAAELESKTVGLTTLQRIVAERTSSAKQNVPHYYVTVDVDVENLELLREAMNDEDPDRKVSINDFIVKACALALQEQPHINASFASGKRKQYGEINIGVAAAVPDGLTLPVLKNCESKTLRQIGAETRDLVGRARENKLKPDELTGSTFAISNMGMMDVESFAAIINEPNGAILAIGMARRTPVVVEDEDGEHVEIGTRMKVTGSFDHRVIDGAVGAEFLKVVREYLEAPTRLLS